MVIFLCHTDGTFPCLSVCTSFPWKLQQCVDVITRIILSYIVLYIAFFFFFKQVRVMLYFCYLMIKVTASCFILEALILRWIACLGSCWHTLRLSLNSPVSYFFYYFHTSATFELHCSKVSASSYVRLINKSSHVMLTSRLNYVFKIYDLDDFTFQPYKLHFC